ncbi:E3 ubiquitin-protein ligase ATL23 [Tripterygium wilfordii]|uniref:E3 ubiquitin-protein ligase ATL23 n=1 Tax=Tripterygium wilfordii TaxID=458696 RepID=A0A7J7D3R4_TRIWF|nr:E3 ubiquitin-protein ligase ATL23 [Tripterygium wilfordii]KAF5740899.1 E3 ubiquitin-protein ligase ATL23 [Tripterygium wilfordii]
MVSSPSPSPASSAPTSSDHAMLVSVFLALFLPCVGMSAVFLIYLFVLWFSTRNQSEFAKPVAGKGLSESELEKVPKVTGKELVMGTECAVCLDEIESEQPARLLPGCNHGFHLQCADAWLSRNSVCPVCRTKLDPQFFDASQDNPC